MSKCLLTTLAESVENDNSLLALGELRVGIVPSTHVTHPYLKTTSTATLTLTIEGDGHFTDSAGTANLGKTVTVTGIDQCTYISVGNYSLKISSKYDIQKLAFMGTNTNNYDENSDFAVFNSKDFSGMKSLQAIGIRADNSSIDLEDTTFLNKNGVWSLAFSVYDRNKSPKGNLSDLAGFVAMNQILIESCNGITGDVNSLETTNMEYLTAWNNTGISGNVNSTLAQKLKTVQLSGCSNVGGNLSAYTGSSELTSLYLAGTKATGRLASLATCPNLTILRLDNTAITGDTSDLAGLTNLTIFSYTNTAITGTWPLT